MPAASLLAAAGKEPGGYRGGRARSRPWAAAVWGALAACFLDSLATLGLPGRRSEGCDIMFGLFRNPLKRHSESRAA
ncbi:MAG: hypothetical protein ACLTSZ_09700 [Lachnospiraceae bacterium]